MTKSTVAKILAAALVWAASALSAHAQSSPGWTYGYVPTPAQWNAAFASKQDYVGAAFLPLSGGTMTGRLTTVAAGLSGSGFNLPHGANPSSPVNGDLWTTALGLFARVNGSTYNLTAAATGSLLVFTTKTAAAAATIDPSVSRVQTLGYATVNDNGGAFYVRTGSAGAASYKFQSADGQWWTLDQNRITPEQFGCFSTSPDCTAALQVMSTWMTTVGPNGVIYDAKPGAAYKVFVQGGSYGSPASIFTLNVARDATFNFNGSYFTTDNDFAATPTYFIFLVSNLGQSITFNNPKLTQTGYLTPLSTAKGMQFITLLGDLPNPGSGSTIINSMVQDGGSLGLSCSNGSISFNSSPTNGPIQLNGYKVSNVYYPLNFQSCGDNFTASGVVATNTGRVYFPYNVNNHDVQISGDGGGAFDAILLKSYADPRLAVSRRGLQDVHVSYRNVGRINNTASASLVALEFQQTVASPTVSAVANNGGGLFRLTVNSTANMATGQTWSVQSLGGNPGSINGLSFVVTVVNGTTVDLQGSTFSAGYTSGGYLAVPSHMKNIAVDLDVDDTNGNQQPAAFVTRKNAVGGGVDVNGAGYVLDNVQVRGTIRNYNYGIPAVQLLTNDTGGAAGAYGVWAGDFITNVGLKGLKVTGSNSSVQIVATNGLLGNLFVSDLYCSSGVTATVTGANANFRPQNVSCSGITDRFAVAAFSPVASQFLTGLTSTNGAFSSAQPAVTDLSGLGTGVASALAINVGSAGALVTNGGALGTPSSGVITNLTGTCTSCNINGTVGATTPAAGTFTTLTANTSLTATIIKSASSITFQVNGSTQAAIVSSAGKWVFGTNTTIGSGPTVGINSNSASSIPNSGVSNPLTMVGTDGSSAIMVTQAFNNGSAFPAGGFYSYVASGTGATPGATASGNFLLDIQGRGANCGAGCPGGFAYNGGFVGIFGKATQAHTSANQGAKLEIYGTPDNTNAGALAAIVQGGVIIGSSGTDPGAGNLLTAGYVSVGTKIRASGSAPTITAGCSGAGSSIVGSDLAGTVTGSTAAATTCTITFNSAYASAANCTALGLSSPLTGAVTIAAGTLQVNFASTANYKFTYNCVAQSGG